MICSEVQGRAIITSATRSPVLGKNIALCRLAVDYCAPGTRVEIGKLDGQQKRIGATVAAGTGVKVDDVKDPTS